AGSRRPRTRPARASPRRPCPQASARRRQRIGTASCSEVLAIVGRGNTRERTRLRQRPSQARRRPTAELGWPPVEHGGGSHAAGPASARDALLRPRAPKWQGPPRGRRSPRAVPLRAGDPRSPQRPRPPSPPRPGRHPGPVSPEAAARAQCLAFPGAEEFTSHGSPTFRVRGGKVFAILAANHHGDGRLALWLKAESGAQEAWVEDDPEHYFVPLYVGKRGWIGVRLDRALPWRAVRDRICESYLAVAPPRLHDPARATPTLPAPDAPPGAGTLDPLAAPRARAV